MIVSTFFYVWCAFELIINMNIDRWIDCLINIFLILSSIKYFFKLINTNCSTVIGINNFEDSERFLFSHWCVYYLLDIKNILQDPMSWIRSDQVSHSSLYQNYKIFGDSPYYYLLQSFTILWGFSSMFRIITWALS